MYGEMNRVIYEHISGILQYHKLKGHIESWVFYMNIYGKCTFNKKKSTQCIMLYYVNDLKIAYYEQSVIDNMATLILHYKRIYI